MNPADRIRVRLLGGFEIVRGDETSRPLRLSTKKVCALAAFLVMSRKQTATRAELATLLWGSCPDQQARQSLRQALVLLRKDLGSPNALFADKEVVRLHPGAWSVDALEFEASADSTDIEDLERAVELFRGEFLAGLVIDEEGFDEWLQAQRNRIHAAAGQALASYAERSDAAGSGRQAMAAAERLLALDPLREDWQRLALRLCARHRGQHDAVARAKAFEALLRCELDVEPELETAALIEKIRRGEIAPIAREGRAAESEVGSCPAQGSISSCPVDSNGAGAQRLHGVVEDRPPKPLGAWAGRIAAGATVAAVVLLGGIVGLMHRGTVGVGGDVPVGKSLEAAASADDVWRSPRLPSQPAEPLVGPGRGLVSIAVLPFVSHGEGGERSATIADMMTDDLTNLLSRVPGVRVISRQTSRSYRSQAVDGAAIGAELGIRYVLKGSVQAQDSQLRVNVELGDAKSRLNIWSGRFERGGADPSAIEAEIADSLGRELEIEVVRAESERGSRDPDVHELIYKGYAAMFDAGASGLPALKQAEKYFTQALERDPENPRAQTGLAGYHAVMALQLRVLDPVPYLAKADAILQHVIEQHPTTSGAHLFLGLVHVARGQPEKAARSFERAIELNASCAPCYGQLGRALVRMGRPAEGLDHLHYAMRLSPRDPSMPSWLGMAGGAELELGHYDKAIEYLDRALAFDPGQPRILLVLVGAHALAGNMSEARAKLAQLQKTQPHLTGEQLVTRFFGAGGGPGLRLKEALQLVLAPASDAQPAPSGSPAEDPNGTGKGITAIAVLPFLSYGDTAGSMQAAAEMVTDNLTNTLSHAPGLRVISRQTMQSYRGQPIDIAAIGAELGVRYILEGSLRMHGDKLRVNVELVDPVTRLPVWSARIEKAGGEQAAVPDEIVGRLGREVQF
jgi:TolB-like protein/DNA-binding SARP family transcriptional activator